MKSSRNKDMNNKSNNKKNHIGEYSNSNLKVTDVKIPLHAWKLLGILRLHCYDGHVCRDNVDTSNTRLDK